MTETSTPGEDAPSNWKLIRRMLALGWQYRAECLCLLALQAALLVLSLAGLSQSGLAIDVIRHAVDSAAPEPHFPMAWRPPAHWTAMQVVLALAAAVLALALVRGGLTYIHTVAVSRLVQQRIVIRLRAEVYDKLQRLSFRFFDRHATGAIMNRVTGDVQAVRSFIDGVIVPVVMLVLSVTVCVAYMVTIHVGLTLACLATLPVVWGLSTAFSAWVRPAYLRNRDLVDQMVLTLTENIRGVHVVKGFAREQDEMERFARATQAVRDQQQWIFWRVSLYTPVVEWLSNLNLAILLVYGGWLVMQHQLPLGSGLIVFVGLLQQFSAQVNRLTGIVNSVQQSLVGARRVFEVLDMPLEVAAPAHPLRSGRARGEVTFDEVSFAYAPGSPVLEQVSLHVEPGECIALVGATGAGKSTLLSLVPRFYDATQGVVRIDGVDVRQWDLDALRASVGMVFQESFLFKDTVAANIAFGHPEATREQIENAARLAAAHDFIGELPEGYDTVLRENGSNLSGGQRQRLAIARALLLQPPILLLDDPTASIDPETEDEILRAVDQAVAGRTTFVIAHRLSTLARADRIAVLDRGRIMELGTHAELLAHGGRYWQAAQLQLVDDHTPRPPREPASLGQGPHWRTGTESGAVRDEPLWEAV